MSSESGGGSLCDDELLEIQTIERLLDTLPTLSDMRKTLTWNSSYGFLHIRSQLSSFEKRLTTMLENLSAPGAYKDLANLVGKEFRTYLDNVLTISFIIENPNSERLLQHLQTLINHFKKLIKQFYGSEKHSSWKNIEPHQNLLMNFQTVAKTCNGAIEKGKKYFQDLHTQFETLCVQCSDPTLRILQTRVDERSYFECIEFATKKLQEFQSDALKKWDNTYYFLEYHKLMLSFAELFKTVSFSIFQCLHLCKWGIHDNIEHINTLKVCKLYEICVYVEVLLSKSDQKEVLSLFLQSLSDMKRILTGDALLLTIEINKILSTSDVDISNFLALVAQLKNILETQNILPNCDQTSDTPAYFKVYTQLLQSIRCCISEDEEYWFSGKKYFLKVEYLMPHSSGFLQMIRYAYMQYKIVTFEQKVLPKFEMIKNDPFIDVYSLGHSCIQQLQALLKYISEKLPHPYEDLKMYSHEVDKFQQIIGLVLEELMKFIFYLTGKEKDTFWLEIKELQKNIVLSLESAINCVSLEMYLKNIKTCVANMTTTINSILSSDFKVHPQKDSLHNIPLITNQDSRFEKTHIVVNFDVIIRRKIWKLEGDTKIKMGMLFSIPGIINNLLVNFDVTQIRHLDDCSVVSCGLSISKYLLGKSLYYKYMLLSSPLYPPVEMLFIKEPITDEEVNHCYRIWNVPNDTSELTVFDSCIYPQVLVDPSLFRYLKGLFKSTKEYKPPEQFKNEQQYCITVHLNNVYEQIEQCRYSSETDVHSVYVTIMSVYSSFLNLKKVNASQLSNRQYPLLNGSCIQIIQELLITLVTKLDEANQPQKIISSLILCRCLMDISKSFSSQNILSLLNVDQEKQTFHEYHTVVSILPNFKLPFMESVLKCVQRVIKLKGKIPWLLIIRSLLLYYWFVRFPKAPFSVDMSSRSLNVTMKSIQELSLFKGISESEIKDLLLHMKANELKDNPYLQLTLLQACRACTKFVYSLVVEHVAPPAIIWALSMEIMNNRDIANQFGKVSALIVKMSMNKPSVQLEKYRHNIIDCLLLLISALQEKSKTFSSMEKQWTEAAFNSVELTLFFTYMEEYEKKSEVLNSIAPFIATWASISLDDKFAGSNQDKLKKELKFWKNLYTLESNCAQWKYQLNCIVSQRFRRVVPFRSQITIFESLISDSNCYGEIVETIKKVIDERLAFASTEDAKILASGSAACKSILSRLVDCKVRVMPTTFDEVLKWDAWPFVLTALVDVSDGISEHSLSACHCVKEIFHRVQEDIAIGNISVRQLQLLREKWDSIVIKILLPIRLNQDCFRKCLDALENRVAVFNLFSYLLRHFALTFSGKLQVMQTLLEKLDRLTTQQSNININHLCCLENNCWLFPELQEAEHLQSMLLPFTVMTAPRLQNDIFHCKWQQLTKNINIDSSLDDICHKVWYPIFDFCGDLMDSLKSKTITLQELGKHFGTYELAETEHTITRLFHAVVKCHSPVCKDIVLLATKFFAITQLTDHTESIANTLVDLIPIHDSCDWIKDVSKQINQWNSLYELSNEADQFIDILSRFELCGESFQSFSKQNIHVFLQSSLCSVTKKDEQILQFLKESKKQATEVRESIRKLGQFKELRIWVRSKSEDVSEMERFIGIALDTVAGEGVDIQDRLIYCWYSRTISTNMGVFKDL